MNTTTTERVRPALVAVTFGSIDDDAANCPDGGVVTFTKRGEAALDQLAMVLSARCTDEPDVIATVLDQVLNAELDDLADALSAIADTYAPRTRPKDAGDGVPDVPEHRRPASRHGDDRDGLPEARRVPGPGLVR